MITSAGNPLTPEGHCTLCQIELITTPRTRAAIIAEGELPVRI